MNIGRNLKPVTQKNENYGWENERRNFREKPNIMYDKIYQNNMLTSLKLVQMEPLQTLLKLKNYTRDSKSQNL